MLLFRQVTLFFLLASVRDLLAEAKSCTPNGQWHLGNTLNTGAEDRQYDYYVPSVASPSALVVFLHGAGGYFGQTPGAYAAWPIVPEADNHGFLAVVPSARTGFLGNSWNDGEDCSDSGSPYPNCPANYPNDVDFIDQLIVHMKQQYSVPAGKVYVMGFSNGGGLATMISCLSVQVDAVAVTGGFYPSEAPWSNYCPQKASSTKYWAGLGTNDGLMTTKQGKAGLKFAVEVLNGCTGGSRKKVLNKENGVTCYEWHKTSNADCAKSRYCQYQGVGHVWFDNAVNAALEFFNADSYPAAITPSLYGTSNACQSGGSDDEEDDDDDEDYEDDDDDDDDDVCLAVSPTTNKNRWCWKKCDTRNQAKCKKTCRKKCNSECLCNELCRDSNEWSLPDRKSKNCKWVAKRPAQRCKKNGEDDDERMKASSACPIACGKCFTKRRRLTSAQIVV